MTLNLFVEGPSDEIFFKEFMSSSFSNEYEKINFIKIAKTTDHKIKKAIDALIEIGDEYAIIVDNDFERNERTKKYKREYLDKTRLVKNMIEGWYLAGFDKEFSNNQKFHRFFPNTEEVNHSKFKLSKPKRHKTEKQFLNFLLSKKKAYCFDEAQKRNNSFKEFYNNLP